MRRRLGDGGVGGVVHRHHADIVAAVVERRDRGLVQDAHRAARQREAAVLGDVEELGEAGIFVAAQRRVDHVIGDDARLLGFVADAGERPLAQGAGLLDAQVDAVGVHYCYSLDCGRQTLPLSPESPLPHRGRRAVTVCG